MRLYSSCYERALTPYARSYFQVVQRRAWIGVSDCRFRALWTRLQDKWSLLCQCVNASVHRLTDDELQDPQIVVSDPAALTHILVKEAENFELPSWFITYVQGN